MKKLVVVVVILAAVLLLAPFGVGKLAESRMNHELDKLVEQAPYFVVAERKWTGGWFKSRQEVTFELAPAFADAMSPAKLDEIFNPEAQGQDAESADADVEGSSGTGEEVPDETPSDEMPSDEAPTDAAPASPIRFKVFNDVLHGPVLGLSGLGLARVDTTLDLPPEVVEKIRELFGPQRALEVRTRIGFFGGGTTTVTSEGRTIKTKDDGTEVSYETFKLAMGYGRNFDSYDFDGKLPKLQIKGDDGAVVVTALTIDGDGERIVGDLYSGDVAFRIEEIAFQGADASKNFKLEDAHYIVETDAKDDFATISAQMGTGAFESPAMQATGLDIKEIHYDFSLRRLRVEPLEKILRAMRDAYTVSPMARTPEAVEAAFIEPMKEHAVEILKHDPEFSFDRIGLVTAEGEGVLKGLIKFVGVTMEDFEVPGGMGLVSKLDADLTVEVAIKLVEKLPNGAMMAGAGVDAGYLTRDGEKYVCHIVFRNGELTVNGKPQMIPGLGGPPGGAMGEPGEMPPGE